MPGFWSRFSIPVVPKLEMHICKSKYPKHFIVFALWSRSHRSTCGTGSRKWSRGRNNKRKSWSPLPRLVIQNNKGTYPLSNNDHCQLIMTGLRHIQTGQFFSIFYLRIIWLVNIVFRALHVPCICICIWHLWWCIWFDENMLHITCWHQCICVFVHICMNV